ncbi:hypothetical protein AMATHDRAFT_44202 [Amanita thiersii Skay4041]|uniref:Uncharacterized protein n=1 Tax=Amanita thiersii Skay4041 TaxID=703135 RepID=A0A2A9NBX5_9AGAR|nr:hypothetical protein AMATHDRAFT_44202 [Amanita thiersii Skay4041]
MESRALSSVATTSTPALLVVPWNDYYAEDITALPHSTTTADMTHRFKTKSSPGLGHSKPSISSRPPQIESAPAPSTSMPLSTGTSTNSYSVGITDSFTRKESITSIIPSLRPTASGLQSGSSRNILNPGAIAGIGVGIAGLLALILWLLIRMTRPYRNLRGNWAHINEYRETSSETMRGSMTNGGQTIRSFRSVSEKLQAPRPQPVPMPAQLQIPFGHSGDPGRIMEDQSGGQQSERMVRLEQRIRELEDRLQPEDDTRRASNPPSYVST